MIYPIFSIVVSLSILQPGITATNNVPLESIQTYSHSQAITKVEYKNYDQSFEFYRSYQLPLIEEARRIEAERIERERLERERIERERLEAERIERERLERLERERLAREAELIRQRQIQAQTAARQKQATRTAPAAPAARIQGDFESMIHQQCAVAGCNGTQLIRVMYCESGGRSNAYNASSGASGLFQQMPQYWAARAARAGVPGASIWDPNAQIIVAAHMFANGQASHWVCK